MKCLILLALVLATPLAQIPTVHDAFALNERTHEIINEQAAGASSIDSTLRDQLGFSEGIRTTFRAAAETNTALRWIGRGGAREDESTALEYLTGKARSFRHFHDPLLLWDRSGLFYPLTIPPRITRFESSIRWAQRSDQDRESGHGNFSWRDARRYFRSALTDPDPTLREQAFADTFRALGQVMHLIADASVPEHVRNDPHAEGWIEDKVGQVGNYEYWVQAQHVKSGTEPAFIRDYLSAPITLDPELLQIAVPSAETIARVPIARLFDSDRYTGSNPDVTNDSRIGIAEVANANFVSEDTYYGEYPHPALANLPKYVGTYSKIGEKRSYYRKEGAGLRVDPVAAECVLDEATGVATFCKDDDVWRQTARHMLPRAVRYGQEVLDYFFRGKLDADVIVDPNNESQYRLIATNASEEALVDGTVTVYADDPQNNVRIEVASASKIQVSGVQKGDPLFDPLSFQPPENAERFMVVYQGTLGQEAQDSATNNPGAVIGKTVGGLRVEEIIQNFIKTPEGTYTLPLPGYPQTIRWGDRDNTLVTRLEPYRFLAYEIARPAGSSEIPLARQPDGSQAVDIKLLSDVSLPLGMSLGTTVEYTETIHYKAYLLSHTDTVNYVLDSCGDPKDLSTCSYSYRDTTTNGEARLVVDETRPITHSFPLILTEATYYGDGPYSWTIDDYALTADGQILAVVAVRSRYYDYWRLDPDAYSFPVADSRYAPYTWLFNTLPREDDWRVWAIVNVGTGEVVASTAPPTIHIAGDSYHTFLSPPKSLFGTIEGPPEALLSVKNHYIDGPTRPDEFVGGGWVPGIDSCPEGEPSNGLSIGKLDEDLGVAYTTLDQFRPEVASLQFPSPPSAPSSASFRLFFRCGAPGSSLKAVSIDVTDRVFGGLRPTRLTASRVGPGAGAGQLALLADQEQPYRDCPSPIFEAAAPAAQASVSYCGGYLARVANWVVNRGNAVVRQEIPFPGGHTLVRASSGAALVTSLLIGGGQNTTLVPLQGAAPSIVFPGVSLTDFFPIEPGLFYNGTEGQFYRRQFPLQRTPLPRSLPPEYADPYNKAIPYHTVTLK
jgi:hypothetical protein